MSEFAAVPLSQASDEQLMLELERRKKDKSSDALSSSSSAAAGGGGGGAKREKDRSNKESGARNETSEGLIGGSFDAKQIEAIKGLRVAVFDRLYQKQVEAEAQRKDDIPITVTLPDGSVKSGIAFKTSAFDIAMGISKGLAESVVIAKVKYSKRYEDDRIVACDEDDEAEAAKAQSGGEGGGKEDSGELWDLTRPLVGDCELKLLKFEDAEAKTVFWHSSSHILGAAIENVYGGHLTIGPPLSAGFYYDFFMGNSTVHDEDFKKIEDKANDYISKKHQFQRLKLSKDEALEMFAGNPFKMQLIQNKVPAGSFTSVYRCGDLIDLCLGPHVPNTGKVKAFSCIKSSSTNWLGKVTNDPLQRLYAISFPDKAQLKQWKEFQEAAKQRDHRLLGGKQELFFFHNLSPGSCFWLPHGARVYNTLIKFIREQYWSRGYEEVITPNIFNLDLWHISGHAQHYKENMFVFDVEGHEWGMKPMNCPGHCLLFAHRLRSYRELPIRIADFGALHRNELSGALTGLTRVRRFQQDDAHIFCRRDQIKSEVLGALDFMRFVYGVFGMTYKLELSTRPAKALGETELWDMAEAQLAEALNEFAGEGNWRVNPGDGAFYGPKIDIKVYDALERIHQCATVQLDFQLPIRFNLEYRGSGTAEKSSSSEDKEGGAAVAPAAGGVVGNNAHPGVAPGHAQANTSPNPSTPGFERPVMVHRAMLGSVERMAAVLTEHFGGKWPFWLSPRQAIVVPVDLKYQDYADKVSQKIHDAGIFVDVDDSTNSLNKKIRNAQIAQYNYILVVGEKEETDATVNIRTRENEVKGTIPVDEFVALCQQLKKDFK